MTNVAVLNCLIVDDEPLALSLLTDYVNKTAGLRLQAAVSAPLNALQIVEEKEVDLVFLDIQMPELSGIQFLNILKKKCMVILTTAYAEYALEGYEHQVVDYLLKPITLERFTIAVNHAKALSGKIGPVTRGEPANEKRSDFIFIKTEYRMTKINLADIRYLEGARDYVIIHTVNDKILTLQSMKSIEDMLPAELFTRVHKSYIVALDKIKFVERGRISIAEQMIPVSDTYKDYFFKKIGLL